MRVLATNDIAPIHVAPGDTLSITWTDEGSREHLLEQYVFERSRVIDRVVIGELSESEAAALGLASGIAGILGRKA